MTQTLPPAGRSAAPLGLLVIGVVAMLVTIRLALESSRGQRWDQRAMDSVYAGPETRETLLSFLGYISIGTTAFALLACIVVALAQGRLASAVAAVSIIAGSNITTQALKHSILDRPDHGFSTLNSLPSGHTTVVVSVVMAALFVSPPALRPVFAFAGAFASTLTGASTVVGGWHRPGDILAALAVCLIWSALAALVLGSRVISTGHTAMTVLALIGASAAGILLIIVGVRPTGGWGGLMDAALVLGAIGIAVALVIGAFARLAPRQP